MTAARSTPDVLRPRLRADLWAEIIPPDHVVVFGDGEHAILQGSVYVELIPLLDGLRKTETIVNDLRGVVSAPEVYFAIDQAIRAGYFVAEGEAGAETPPDERTFWDRAGVATDFVKAVLRKARVGVVALGETAGGGLDRALQDAGVVVAEPDDLLVVVTDDYLRPELDALNENALREGRPWLLVNPGGSVPWIGPIFVPGKTGCWRCLAQRLTCNRQVERFLVERKARRRPLAHRCASWAPGVDAAHSAVALEVIKWLTAPDDLTVEGRVVTIDLVRSELESHVMTRRPQCTACGSPRERRPVRPSIDRSAKRFEDEGGVRCVPPERTLEQFGHLVSPITGVISALEEKSLLDGDVPIYSVVAVHDFPMFREQMNVLAANVAGRSGGKGVSLTQARASALGEAVERYSGIWRGEEEIEVRTTAHALGDEAVDLDECLGFSVLQRRNREAWNSQLTNPRHIVPQRLDPDLEVSWTPLWSLRSGQFRYLPSAFCYFGHPDMTHHFCLSDTNGCAAGNVLSEAILQGLLELVERDAVAIWWYNRTPCPEVDVETFRLRYWTRLRADYAARGRSLWMLDVTSDLGVPTFAAVSARADHPVEDVILGFGAHLDPRIAALRALTEMNQFYPFVAKRRDDGATVYETRDAETLAWLETATRASEPYLLPDPGKAAHTRSDYARPEGADVADDLEAALRAVDSAGLETLVLDQTRPDLGMAVCRVVVPGLCHFWRRLGFRRLYEVPVRLGRLERPHAEEDLNPFSLFV